MVFDNLCSDSLILVLKSFGFMSYVGNRVMSFIKRFPQEEVYILCRTCTDHGVTLLINIRRDPVFLGAWSQFASVRGSSTSVHICYRPKVGLHFEVFVQLHLMLR